MSVTGRVLVVALLLATVCSQVTFIPTETQPPSSEAELACSCLGCSDRLHMQKVFCESATVVQGRVTEKSSHDSPQGMWNSVQHKEHLHWNYGFPPRHYELSVRVLAVYSNLGDTKVSVGDKITVRYQSHGGHCPMCETLVETFEDDMWMDRRIHKSNKYIFFLPGLVGGFGEKLEAVMGQCTKVWRYSKRGNKVLGHIPLVQRYILSATECSKCRVSGCYQDKCVKASEEEECDDVILNTDWRDNVCQPILDHGLCYYNPNTDLCRWTSISEGGFRSRKLIEECLPAE